MRIIKNYIQLLLLVVLPCLAWSQNDIKVNWLTIEEAIEAQKEEPRKIFIDLYTDWCGWCKRMDVQTFQQPHIAQYLNNNFYAVKFNAEYKSDIKYKGETFQYVRSGKKGYHELAAKLANYRLSYPTLIFLDENMDIIQPIPGYQDEKTFELIMIYFAEDYYISTPWKRYIKTKKMLIPAKSGKS